MVNWLKELAGLLTGETPCPFSCPRCGSKNTVRRGGSLGRLRAPAPPLTGRFLLCCKDCGYKGYVVS